jgi:hypothetical protein
LRLRPSGKVKTYFRRIGFSVSGFAAAVLSMPLFAHANPIELPEKPVTPEISFLVPTIVQSNDKPSARVWSIFER